MIGLQFELPPEQAVLLSPPTTAVDPQIAGAPLGPIPPNAHLVRRHAPATAAAQLPPPELRLLQTLRTMVAAFPEVLGLLPPASATPQEEGELRRAAPATAVPVAHHQQLGLDPAVLPVPSDRAAVGGIEKPQFLGFLPIPPSAAAPGVFEARRPPRQAALDHPTSAAPLSSHPDAPGGPPVYSSPSWRWKV